MTEKFESQSDLSPELSVEEIIENLKNEALTLSSKQIMRLSGLYPQEIQLIQQHWPTFHPQRIIGVLEDMELLTEDYPGVDFSDIFMLGLEDKQDQVVIISIRGLWDEEKASIATKALEILQASPEPSLHVALSIISLLGEFIVLAEFNKIPESLANKIKTILTTIYQNSSNESLRQRALEVLSAATELKFDLNQAIDKAIHDYNDDWVRSALIAIGKSGKTQWNDYVFDNLDSPIEDIRIEAIRTAGDLELQDALSELYAATKEGIKEIRMAAAWALSNFSDKNIHSTLEEMLENAEDEEEEALIEDAIDNHMISSEIMSFNFLDIKEKPLHIDDLDDLDLGDEIEEIDSE